MPESVVVDALAELHDNGKQFAADFLNGDVNRADLLKQVVKCNSILQKKRIGSNVMQQLPRPG